MLHLSAFPLELDWHWIWLIVAAFLAGVLNAVAGGGSFLLFPAMLGMKMLPIQANATNTVALWPGQLTSVAAYRDDIRKNPRLAAAHGPRGAFGRDSGRAGAAEHAAEDISAPGAVAVAGGGRHFCAQRSGLPLAGAGARAPLPEPRILLTPSAGLFPPSWSASISATSARAPAF